MTERGYLALAATLLTVVMVALIGSRGPWSGPELFELTHAHGVHLGDLPVFTLWVLGFSACVRRWRRA